MLRVISEREHSSKINSLKNNSSRNITPSFNIVIEGAEHLSTWDAEIASLESENKILNINVWGDSLSVGSVAGGSPYERRQYGFPGRLAERFKKRYDDVGIGLLTSSYQNGVGSYWTQTGTWTNKYGVGFGSNVRTTAVQGSSMSTTFNGNGVKVYILGHSDNTYAGGTFDIYIDGVLQESVSTAKSGFEVITTNITGLTDEYHTFEIVKQDDTTYASFMGICEQKGIKGVRVNMMGVGAQTSEVGIYSQAMSAMSSETLWDAKLTIIEHGVNDLKDQVPLSTYESNLESMITYAKNTGDVILLWPSIRNISTVAEPKTLLQSSYIDVMETLAIKHNCCFINMYATLGSDFNKAANSLCVLYDTVHLNREGHELLSKILFNTVN